MIPRYFLPSLKSVGLSVQERKRKKDFQEHSHGDHLGFSIGTILATFDVQVISICPTKIQVIWPFGSKEVAKNRVSRWQPRPPTWISNWNSFNDVDLQDTPMRPAKFQVNWPFSAGEEAKNRFLRCRAWRLSWI